MSAAQEPVLERRYRLLLRCYPPSHRAAHREEMLGVLLAAGPWQDALAVLSVITPALVLVIAALNLAVTTREVVAMDQAYPLALTLAHLLTVVLHWTAAWTGEPLGMGSSS